MKSRAQELVKQADKDSELVDRLSGEASSMFESLLERVEGYRAIQESHSLKSMAISPLEDISGAAKRLGVQGIDKIGSIIEELANGMERLQSTDPAVQPPSALNDVAPIGTPKAQSKPIGESSSKASSLPKFTWASSTTAADSVLQKTSLLDIQKEELQSKDEEA